MENFRFHFSNFCYLLLVLIFLVKTESSLDPLEHSFYSNQTKTELVAAREPEYGLNFISVEAPLKQTTVSTPPPIDFSSRQRFSLIYYDNYVRHQLKSFKCSFPPICLFTSILQKKNVWHQPSDEVPLQSA